jgi:Flp pilus assembly protein TadD
VSLINKVINDLEDRQAFTEKNKNRVFRGLSPAENLNHKNKLLTANLFAVMLFLLASVSATYALMGYRADAVLQEAVIDGQQQLEIVELVDTSQALVESIVGSSEEIISPFVSVELDTRQTERALKLDFSLSSFNISKPKPQLVEHIAVDESVARIEAIELNENGNAVFLRLTLASEVKYRAYPLSNPNRVVIEFDNAIFDGVLPDLIDYDGVRNIRLQQKRSGKLIMVMDTTDSYTINKMGLTPSAQGYAFTLSMVSTTTAEQANNNHFVETEKEISETSSAEVAEYGEMKKNINANNDAEQSRRMYMDAQEAYRVGRFMRANALLKALLNKNADHKAARTLLANKLIAQGQLVRAEELLKEGLSTQGGNSDWTNLYARLLVSKGEIDTAIAVLTSVAPEIHKEPDYYAFLAALYQKRERHADAVHTYRQVLQARPDNSVWWMGLAISLEALQQNSEALFAYNKALQGNSMSQDLRKYVHGKINYLNKRG